MEASKEKQRHILLTAFLGFMIAYDIIQISMGWTGFNKDQFVHPQSTRFLVLVIQNVAYIICCIALFRWKKWGFWAICAIGIVSWGLDLSLGGDGWSFVEYVIEVGILYFLLKIGEEQNAWDQLE